MSVLAASSFKPVSFRPNSFYSRRGITFVEILLASVILVSVLLPIGSLIFGGLRQSESSKSFNIGANIASNVMDKLLSVNVPFRAILVDGGPTVGTIMGDSGLGDGIDGARAGMEALPTASFAPEFATLENEIFAALGKVHSSGNTRVINDKGFVFEILWFAGIYKDNAPGEMKYKEELTFSFFRNPYVAVNETEKTNVVLGPSNATNPEFSPYFATGNPLNLPGLPAPLTDPKDPRSQAGWPVIDYDTEPTYETVTTKISDDGSGADLEFPLVTYDLEEFNEAEGSLMKIIVGVRWGSAAGIDRKGLGAARRAHEFWLVSIKGRIQEG